MQTKFINKKINYDGSQLSSHWIFENTGITGDAAVAFTGGCDVNPAFMVDLEDLSTHSSIYSPEMLHFIAEFFDHDLEKCILKQRLFICIIEELIKEYRKNLDIQRDGDDLYIVKKGKRLKLTVSIATVSPVSTLIHAGINIISDKVPVPACGLKEIMIRDSKKFGLDVLKRFSKEMIGAAYARTKVKPVR
ncbi:MAG: DUF366 family protein [Firmicutes bacterium]|nr:DUF366 family protein [Bacillota bacterium]